MASVSLALSIQLSQASNYSRNSKVPQGEPGRTAFNCPWKPGLYVAIRRRQAGAGSAGPGSNSCQGGPPGHLAASGAVLDCNGYPHLGLSPRSRHAPPHYTCGVFSRRAQQQQGAKFCDRLLCICQLQDSSHCLSRGDRHPSTLCSISQSC